MGMGGEEGGGIFAQSPAGHSERRGRSPCEGRVLRPNQGLSTVFALGRRLGSDGAVNWPQESETPGCAWWTWGVLPTLGLRPHLP